MIGPYRLLPKKVLGQGSSSVVRQAEHVITGEHVAVKILPRKRDRKNAHLEWRTAVKACREASALHAVSHPNVVKLHGTYQNPKYLFLVMELVRGIELYHFLRSKPAQRLAPREALQVFAEVVKGVVACHRRGVAHRDIKTENVMLDTKGNVKLVDFGLANHAAKALRTQCGSSFYVAPEICRGEAYNGKQTDTWSLGVLLYTMLVGEYPFHDENEAKMLTKIVHSPVTIPSSLGPQLTDLLHKLLAKNPKERIPSHRIPHHHVFYDSKGRNIFFDANDLALASAQQPSSRPRASPPASRSFEMGWRATHVQSQGDSKQQNNRRGKPRESTDAKERKKIAKQASVRSAD